MKAWYFPVCRNQDFDCVWWLFQVKYKEKYEKERGKAMLDFETPTYVTAKEAQHMQSQVNTLSVSYTCDALNISSFSSQPAVYSPVLECLLLFSDMFKLVGLGDYLY